MEDKKLTAREKMGMYCMFFIVRWMVPKEKMDEDMIQLMKDMHHQVRCGL